MRKEMNSLYSQVTSHDMITLMIKMQTNRVERHVNQEIFSGTRKRFNHHICSTRFIFFSDYYRDNNFLQINVYVYLYSIIDILLCYYFYCFIVNLIVIYKYSLIS